MPDILHQLTVAAPASRVYTALTEPDGLAAWWTTDVEAETELGSIAAFGFFGRQTVFQMRIEDLIPGELVRWHCLGGHPEWEHTELTFDLSESAEGSTTVYFAHRGWESTDGILATCSFDWAGYLMSLRDYLETGTGRPHDAQTTQA